MAEFPIGVPTHWNGKDVEEYLEDIESLLSENGIYDDNGEVSKGSVLGAMAPDIAFLFFYLVSMVGTPWLCIGIFRHIYITKAGLFVVSSTLHILEIALKDQGEKKEKFYSDHHDLFSTHQPEISHSALTSGLLAFTIFSEMFRLLDEILTFLLIYELYLCTSKMEVKKYRISTLIKKVIAAAVISLLATGLEKNYYFVGHEEWREILYYLIPVQSFVSLILTVLTSYFGSQVVFALKRSNEFHDGNVSGAYNRKVTLIIRVTVILILQLVKFLMRVAGVIFVAATLISHCSFQGKLSNIHAIEDCVATTDNTFFTVKGYITKSFCVPFEFLSLLFTKAYMKCKSASN